MSSQAPLWEGREERLVRYLLGDLPPGEQAEIETRLFEERGFHAELLAAGDDLIDAYLSETLPAEDRARFETHFLSSPRRRQRLEFMKVLVAAVQETAAARRAAQTVPRRSVLPWLLAAAVLLAATGLVVVLLRPGVPPGPDVAGGSPTPAPVPVPSATPVEIRVVRLPPAPKEPVEVALAGETHTVRLEVPVDHDRHPTWEAAVRTPAGATVWRAKKLVPSAADAPLAVVVPARLLVSDAYTLHVRGETLRDAPPQSGTSVTYTLRIARQPAQRQSP